MQESKSSTDKADMFYLVWIQTCIVAEGQNWQQQ